MLKLTKALQDWLVANREIEEDASEEDFRLEAGKALADGTLTSEKFTELIQSEKAKEANVFVDRLNKMSDSIADLTKALLAGKEEKKAAEAKEGEKKVDMGAAREELEDVSGVIVDNSTAKDGEVETKAHVKKPREIFDTSTKAMVYPEMTRKGMRHQMAGRPIVVDCGTRELNEPSEYDKACAGAWLKFRIAATHFKDAHLAWNRLPEIDKMLIEDVCDTGMFDDTEEDEKPRFVKGYRGGRKALLDDAISGGFEAAPIVFDDMVIETPRLFGELWPLINEVPLPRGRRVEGVSIGTVTVGWGGVDAAAIALFNTASYVAAFDTTIYRCQGAVEIGLDFLSDSPIDFGATIARQYGEQLLVSLDNVVATGNGTTQPQGIMNATGTTVVAFGLATTLGAYESLLFGIHKRELLPNVMNSYVFCGTDTSYSRARGLNVTAADQRRLGGGEANQGGYRSYQWMGRPYKINESLTNQQIFCGVLARWRGYRRKGFTLRTSTEGSTLIRANEMLVTFTARYGGQAERGACFALTTTAPV